MKTDLSWIIMCFGVEQRCRTLADSKVYVFASEGRILDDLIGSDITVN